MNRHACMYPQHHLAHPQAQHETSGKAGPGREIGHEKVHHPASNTLQPASSSSPSEPVHCSLVGIGHCLPVDCCHPTTSEVLPSMSAQPALLSILRTCSSTKTPPSRKPAALRPFLTNSPVETPATAPNERLRRSTELSTAGGSLARVSLPDPGPCTLTVCGSA